MHLKSNSIWLYSSRTFYLIHRWMCAFGIWLVLCVNYSFHYRNCSQLSPMDFHTHSPLICFSISLSDMDLVTIVQVMGNYHYNVIAFNSKFLYSNLPSREHRLLRGFDCWSNSCHRVPFLYFLQCWIDYLNSHFDFNLYNIYLYEFSCCFLLGTLLSWLRPNEYALASSFCFPFSDNNHASCCNWISRCTVARSICSYSLDVGTGWWGCPSSWNCENRQLWLMQLLCRIAYNIISVNQDVDDTTSRQTYTHIPCK